MSQDHYLMKGIELLQAGKPGDAEAFFFRSLEELPDDPNAIHLLGVACGAQGRHAEAVGHLRKAVKLLPEAAAIQFNLGRALEACGQLEDAAEAYYETQRLDPSLGEASVRLQSLGLPTAKEPALQDALGQATDLLAQDLPERAVLELTRLLTTHPEEPRAWAKLGAAYSVLGRPRESVEAASRSLALDPLQPGVWSECLMNLMYLDGITEADFFEEHLEFGHYHGGAPSQPLPFEDRDWSPERRLRVGYLSPDLCTHSVSQFLEPLLSHHDPEQVEAHAFSDVVFPDETTRRLKGLFHAWHPVRGLENAELVELIRGQGIDVLVELAGHTHGNRLAMMPMRPAPVQLTWLGYPGTTGLDCFEGRIVDPIVEPEGSDLLSSEPLIRIKGGWLSYEPPLDVPEVASLPALKNGFITFGSFNNFAKLSPQTLQLWAALLRRLPGSRLVLKSSKTYQGDLQDDLLETFADQGVDPSRVSLLPLAPTRAAHLEAYSRMDIALDTLNFNGITTSFEALWMGVPLVTLSGGRHSARCGASLLTQLGLETLIAPNAEAFVDRALKLGSDLPALAALRANLRKRMAESPACDATGFARAMEATYRQLWRKRSS